jgi:beta-glucosidase-like glycosyl hydrolase
MAVAFVRAVQAAGVGACVKHYVATSRRPTAPPISRGWNRRTLREVFLAPFERVVRDAAVRSGRVPESVVDDKVVRILAVAKRVDALSGRPGQVEPYRVPTAYRSRTALEVRELLRSVAARSTVVLRNEGGLLPLAGERRPRTIALIGDSALDPTRRHVPLAPRRPATTGCAPGAPAAIGARRPSSTCRNRLMR